MKIRLIGRTTSWLVCAAVLSSAPSALAGTYDLDGAHTTVGFSISHLFTNVQGRFNKSSGTIDFDPAKPEATAVRGVIEAATIDTNNEKRDKHLRSGDFFDVETFPTIEFASTGVSSVDGKNLKLAGNLTIHGVTRPVVLDFTYLGEGMDPWGNTRAGFSATVTINRGDYGLGWNQVLETGGVLVGEEVSIRIDAEAMPKAG